VDISTVNWFAVIVAALSNFCIGGLWYSPLLFGKAWIKENHFSPDDLKNRYMPKIFGLTLLFSIVIAFNLALFLNDAKTTASWGAIAGFLAGFGWVTMSIYIIGLFEKKSTKYIFINGGYISISFIVMGFIIGLWR